MQMHESPAFRRMCKTTSGAKRSEPKSAQAQECSPQLPSRSFSSARCGARLWANGASRSPLSVQPAQAARPLAGSAPREVRSEMQERQSTRFLATSWPLAEYQAAVRVVEPVAHLQRWTLKPPRAVLRQTVRPNPSLERTSTGLALGPRTGQCHHPLRGPSTNPVASAQLKR